MKKETKTKKAIDNSPLDLRTDYQKKKEKREKEIYEDWTVLMAQPGAKATVVFQTLAKKYDLNSYATLWGIRKRVEKQKLKNVQQ